MVNMGYRSHSRVRLFVTKLAPGGVDRTLNWVLSSAERSRGGSTLHHCYILTSWQLPPSASDVPLGRAGRVGAQRHSRPLRFAAKENEGRFRCHGHDQSGPCCPPYLKRSSHCRNSHCRGGGLPIRGQDRFREWRRGGSRCESSNHTDMRRPNWERKTHDLRKGKKCKQDLLTC